MANDPEVVAMEMDWVIETKNLSGVSDGGRKRGAYPIPLLS